MRALDGLCDGYVTRCCRDVVSCVTRCSNRGGASDLSSLPSRARIRPTRMTDTPVVLQMRGICKQYPGVQALNDAALELRAGEVHVLLGENGAGKSTLMKILSGAVRRDAGQV